MTRKEMTKKTGADAIAAGAMNLMRDCVEGRPGQRLLIVEEARGAGWYDEDAPRMAAAAARALGMIVYETEAPAGLSDPEDFSRLSEALRGFDHVVFFARVGDQIRFSGLDGAPPATMCYALDRAMLEGDFGGACHHGLSELRGVIDEACAAATEIRVTCPRGTEIAGRPAGPTPSDVAIRRFPMLVPRPVIADGFTGRVALSRFLVGAGATFYDPYCLPLARDVFARLTKGRIAGFDGPPEVVRQVTAHYLHVAELTGEAPWTVHSWHAGIHPGCGFDREAEGEIMRWSACAFGNPRILHFHTCGTEAPGEISWNVIDPTVELDGVALWDRGRLRPERLAAGRATLDRHPNIAALFAAPCRAIGLN